MGESLFAFIETDNGPVLKTTAPHLRGHFYLDYAEGNLGYRLTPKRVMHEPLAKIIDKSAWVFDATGGILKDAIIMAMLGCRVWSCEAHPIIAQLVLHALERVKNDALLEATFSKNQFQFFAVDASTILAELAALPKDHERPDIVYMDPMFPPKQKTSIAKKEMQWLQQIHAATSTMYPHYNVSSSEQIFHDALNIAQKRVIVKRPARGEFLVPTPLPNFSKSFRSARFDVYLSKNYRALNT